MAPARPFLVNSNGKGLRCMSNCEDAFSGMEAFLQKHTKVPEVPDDGEIDITECTGTNFKNIRMGEKEDPDATEYSSSFGDTISEREHCSVLSEAEVESQFCGDNNLASARHRFSGVFRKRKKKLTAQWRKFIRPLMWRCKWTELKIKEFESQASSYERKLAAYDLGKSKELDQSILEGGSKSAPISSQYPRKKAMKRRKRKRVEQTIEVTSYLSRHNLFSYFENTRSDPDGTSTTDDVGNQVLTDQNADDNDEFCINDDQSFLEFKDGDNSLEWILWKIEIAYNRVQKLKTQLGDLMSKHAGKFSSSENLSLLGPYDAQTSSAHSPTLSAGNGDTISMGAMFAIPKATQNISEYDNGDLVMPENLRSSYGEAIHVPDIIETTAGLLSAADMTLPKPQIEDSCEAILENVLIHNQTAKVERHTFQKISNQPIMNHQVPKQGEQEESSNPTPVVVKLEPDLDAKADMPPEQSTLSSSLASEFHFPKNKRKRGERKASSGGWSLKHSSEPDTL